MSLLDKLMGKRADEPAKETLEERLEAIYVKATENDTGLDTDFGPTDDEPKIEGYEVEFINGDVEEVTAEWMLAKTEWKLEEGRPVQDPDALVLEPRSRDKIPEKWDATHRRKNNF